MQTQGGLDERRGWGPPEGVLKFGFGRDVLPQNLKEDPYKYQFLKQKWPIHIPNCSSLGQILSKNHLICPKFS